ncbi:MAG: hypothetical protein H0T21_04035 [Gemmatimonadaceae bacterium]|jgi:hypothetical protein|nr:hypothetical protein [Gemmatimonadaceae bacterium]
MAVKVITKPDRRYFQDKDGRFHLVENLSLTASTPVYPAVLHKMKRTMILADDRSHAVVSLDKDMCVARNADMLAVLVAHQQPTPETWASLKEHMDAETAQAEVVQEAKSKALFERRRKAAEAR